MIHRLQHIARTIVSGVLALALLGVFATFGLTVTAAVAALLLLGLIVGAIARMGARFSSPQVVAAVYPSARQSASFA